MSTQLQLRRGNTAQTAVFTGVIAEVTVDTDQKTITVHDGVTVGGNYLITKSQLEANLTLISGVNTTQNTNITAVNNFAAGAYTVANTARTSATAALDSVSSAYATANTNATNIAAIELLTDAAFLKANAANDYATSAFGKANSANNLASSAYNQANATNEYATSCFAVANNKLALAGGTITGSLVVNNNITTNNITLTNFTNFADANNLVVPGNTSIIIDTFSKDTYRTVKYIVQATNETDVHACEVLVSHNDTNVFMAQYANVASLPFITLSTSGDANNVYLSASSNTTNTNIILQKISLSDGIEFISPIQGDLMTQSGTQDLLLQSGTEDLNL